MTITYFSKNIPTDCGSDVWLTVPRNSLWIRNQLDVTFVLSFFLLYKFYKRSEVKSYETKARFILNWVLFYLIVEVVRLVSLVNEKLSCLY